MSLLDALLLDPVRMNMWIAVRDDGIYGTGTQTDPYDGSSVEIFDKLMREVIGENTCIHLGPGEFQTAGYYDGQASNTGWQAKKGMRIVGSGIDVTTLKLVNTTNTIQRVYAIGHALTSETVDFFEISHLTVDCNLDVVGGSTAGAVRVMGSHSRVFRVKVKNWGTHSSVVAGFVVVCLTGDSSVGMNGVLDSGIEECIAVEPGASPSSSTVTIFHVGPRETADPKDDETFGVGVFIRNCFVDGGQTTEEAFEAADFRALAMSGCKSGTVEGNCITNIRCGGPFQADTPTRSLIVRSNTFRNVWQGPYWKMASARVESLLVEGNLIELAASAPGTTFGIHLDFGDDPLPCVYENVVVRNNHLRFADGIINAACSASGFRIARAENVIVEGNMLEVNPAEPIEYANCGHIKHLENRTFDGELIARLDTTTGKYLEELGIPAEDAVIMACYARRS